MSYIGRNMRNRFPLWSETRRNESSNAAMVLDAIGESLENERRSALQSIESSFVLSGNPLGEPGHFYRISQPKIEEYLNYKKENIFFNSLRAEGKIENNTFFLEPKYSYEEIVLSSPTRYKESFIKAENCRLLSIVEELPEAEDEHFKFQKTELLKESKFVSKEIFDFKNEINKIYIKIDSSKEYRSKFDEINFDGHYSIVLRGVSEANELIEETIEIKDDAVYESKNYFKCLKPLIQDNEIRGGGSIEVYGVKANIKIYKKPISKEFYIDEKSTISKISNELGYNTLIENNIKYKLSHSSEESYIEYIFNSYGKGADYKTKDATLSGSYFEEALSKRVIVNENLEPIKIESFCLDSIRNKFLTLDKEFTLREYDVNRDGFSSKNIKRTKEVDLAFETENQRLFLNETIKMNLFLERAKGDIQFVFIGRQTPDRRISYESNSDFNFEFLQEDLSWGERFHFFENLKFVEDKFEEFNSIQFECTHQELGQYDYYVYSLKNFLVERSLLNKIKTGNEDEAELKKIIEKEVRETNQKKVTINSYSVLCEEISPLNSYNIDKESILYKVGELSGNLINVQPLHSTEIILAPNESYILENSTLSIWYESSENDLMFSVNLENINYIFKLNKFYDYIFFDFDSGEAVTREFYEEVYLNVNEEYESTIYSTNGLYEGKIEKTRNSTWLDELAFNYGFSREINENLNDFRHRMAKAVRGTLTREKDSFYKSLGYITKEKDIDAFRILKVNESDNINIEITSNRFLIKLEEEIKYCQRFENVKFLIDLYQDLSQIDFIIVEILEENDSWKYLKTKNLMPKNSSRQKMNLLVRSQSQLLPNENIGQIHDLEGDFVNNVFEEQIVSANNYSLEDNVLHKYKLDSENVTYQYEDFPFIVKWLPIKACAVTDENFDDIIKEEIYEYNSYGIDPILEVKETERFLSQKGSVIVNKILRKQNTYWGE